MDLQDDCRVCAENNWKFLGKIMNSFLLINRQTQMTLNTLMVKVNRSELKLTLNYIHIS